MLISKHKMRIKIDKNDIRTIILEMIYFILLCIFYVTWLNPHWGYYGFTSSFSGYCLFFAAIYNMFLSYETSKILKRNTFTDHIILLMIQLYFIPQGVLVSFQNNNLSFYAFVAIYGVLLIYFNNRIDFNKRKGRLDISSPIPVYECFIIVLAITMLAISGIFSGFRVSFNISDYYEYRADYRLYELPHAFRMAFHWSQTLLPMGLLYALTNKRKLLAALVMVANVLCFSFNGKKSVFFIVVLVILIHFFYKENLIKRLPFIMDFLVIAAFLEMLIRNGTSFIATHFIRRLIFIPPYLGSVYFDYFQTHELDYLRSSVLRRFGFVSPYPDGIPIKLGQVVYGRTANANTGLCGDAFANFGWLSLMAYPLVLIITFKLLERYSHNLDGKMKILIAVLLAYTFISGSYFTNLWTNGIIALGVVMILYPRKKEIKGVWER